MNKVIMNDLRSKLLIVLLGVFMTLMSSHVIAETSLSAIEIMERVDEESRK